MKMSIHQYYGYNDDLWPDYLRGLRVTVTLRAAEFLRFVCTVGE